MTSIHMYAQVVSQICLLHPCTGLSYTLGGNTVSAISTIQAKNLPNTPHKTLTFYL